MHLLCVISFLDNGFFFNHRRNYEHAGIWLQWKRRNILWIWLRQQNPAENGALPKFLLCVRIGIKMKLPFLLAIFIILIHSHLLHLSWSPKTQDTIHCQGMSPSLVTSSLFVTFSLFFSKCKCSFIGKSSCWTLSLLIIK